MIMTKKIINTIFICALCKCLFGQIDTSSGSFYEVYVKVLSRSCALASCHDGSFEPDFRTPQSAYYTTVYQPIIKNNSSGSFAYRVVPFDKINSLLYERTINCCFVNFNDRMPLAKDTLSTEDELLISNWILTGAKDLCGVSPLKP